MNKILTIFCEIGYVLITLKDNKLVKINLIKAKKYEMFQSDNLNILSEFERKLISQFNRYFNKEVIEFDIPIEYPSSATSFQKLVWENVRKIKYGNFKTYKDIAYQIGNKLAFRAVGNALNKNPFPIIIPCHRVIGSNRNLGGFLSDIEWKKYLLKLEGII